MRYVINGAEYTKEEIVHRYLPLVKHIARRHYMRAPRSIELGDLINEGILGLLDALHKFDSTRNVKFETYAGLRINGAIIDALRASDWAPRSVREGTRRVTASYADLEARLRRAPTRAEVSETLGCTVQELHKMESDTHVAAVRSLSEPAGGDSDYDVALGDSLADAGPEASHSIRQLEARAELAAAIENLPRQQRMLITLIYFKGMPVNRVAAIMGVSASRVSQVRTKALTALREMLRAQSWFEPEQYGDLVA